jgi:hypothetical protein
LCSRLQIQHITTTAFHPCSNGMVERCHRQLKDALRARSAANDWPDHLPWVLLGLRAAPKEDSAVSSAEMVLGDPLVLPGQPPTAGEPPPPSQRSYRDALLGGPTRHVPTRPLPPAQAGLPACRRLHRCMRGPTRSWSGARRCSGCRLATEKKWSLWTASNRTWGRSQCSRRRCRREVGFLIHHCRLRTTALRGVLWRHRIYD